MTGITEKPAGKAGKSQSGHSVTKFATDLPHLMNRAIFPHRPEDGGSNIVADNELESLTSVAVGSTAYVITPGGQQINYVCVDAFNGHNDVTGYDALQKDDGTVVWGSAELIVYTCLGDAYNVRVACFNRA